MKFFQTLIPLLEKYHVKICLENLYESVGQRIAEGVCANPADAIAYIDKLNELAGKQLFGLCLDSGHLQLTHQDSYRYIQLLGNRIKLLHLHEMMELQTSIRCHILLETVKGWDKTGNNL